MAEGPYAANHILYTWSGALPGGELWNVGMRTSAADVDQAQLQSLTDQAGAFFKTMWESTGSVLQINPAGVTFTNTTGRVVRTDGTSLLVAASVVSHSVSIGPTQGAPNQTALVASLLTNRAGRSGRGRIYLPMLSPSFTAGQDRLPSSITAPISTAVAQLITNLNGMIVIGGPAGPFPINIQSRSIPAAASPVTRVAVGDVADTQRRRRDKIIEAYTVTAV